jgi:hypothetical protein
MKHKNSIVLKEGNGGHFHKLNGDFEITDKKQNNEFFINEIKVKKGVVTHEEHGDIILEPGLYDVYTQQEYDPFFNNFRQVYD